MNEKQREVILFTFKCMSYIYGKTFIQKLFYVFKRQIEGLDLFDYYPYNYGPFSKELNQAVNDLIEEGMIEEKRSGDYFIYGITEKGLKTSPTQKNLNDKEQKAIKQVCEHVKDFKPRDMLDYVYRKYPDTTINSLLKGQSGRKNFF